MARRPDYEGVIADEIDSLPIKARIAFGARWARHSAPWVCAWGRHEGDERAVEQLVKAAEDHAAARPVNLYSHELACARDVVVKRAELESDSEIRPAEHTAYAVIAAFDAARAIDPTEITTHATKAVNEAGFGIRRFVGMKLEFHARDDIRNELQLLERASKHERWTDQTPVRPEFFSPDAMVERHILLAANDLCIDLCKLVAANVRVLNFVEWREVERIVATAFEGLGFEVELTPAAKDGGKDIIARCELRGHLHTYYIEVKHWRSGKRVSMKELSHFIQVNVRCRTDGALFLSTSGYTSTVHERLAEVTQRRLQLGDNETIVSLCQQFVRQQGCAIWRSVDVLPSAVFAQLAGLASVPSVQK
jgi:restriction endonuclease